MYNRLTVFVPTRSLFTLLVYIENNIVHCNIEYI